MKRFFSKNMMIIAPVLVAVLTALDQWTKTLAVQHLKGKEPFVIWDGVLEFRYHENTGAAWGMLKEQQVLFYILTIIFCAVVLIEIYRLRRDIRYMPFNYTLILVLAGALGNFIDRVLNQFVVDFIYVKLIDFPIFNVADCYITVSVVILVLLMFFYYSDEEFDRMIPLFSGKKKKEA